MTCTKCNRLIDLDSRFCKHCGASVPVRLPDAVVPGPSAARRSASEPVSPVVKTREDPPRREGRPDVPAESRARDKSPRDRRLAPADPAPDDDEQRIWHGRRSWRSFHGAWAIWCIAFVAFVVLIFDQTETGSSLRIWSWAVAAASALAMYVRQALLVYQERYRLTNLRLFTDRGILSRVTDQTELVRIDDVRIRQGLVDRMVDTGDVEIIGSDSTDENLVLKSVARPAEVAEMLLKHVRNLRNKKMLYVDRA